MPLPRRQTAVRRIAELITAAAIIVFAFYFPATARGRIYLVTAAVVALVGLNLLRKWPSV